MNSLSMWRSDYNPTPSRIQPGKPSSVSSTGQRQWPGSRKTGLMLRQESRARAGINPKQSRSCSGTEKVVGDRPPTETCRAQTAREIGPRLPLGASKSRSKSLRSRFCIEWPKFGAPGTMRTSAPSEVDNSRSRSNFGLMALPPLPLSAIEICLH
jgi:hypothetical protein